MARREFIGAVTATAVGLTHAPTAAGAARPGETRRGDMLYRKLGRTGVEVSAIGLGGHHIGRQKEEGESVAIIHAAIDAGITFLDNSWDYHDGLSETRMGTALRGGYRKKVFLMTKIDGRTRKAAAAQIDDSLRRLKTDVIDLVQHHEVIRLEDPDRVFAPGGSMEAVEAARKAGKIRFVGFTGHKDPAVHLRMLEVATAHDYQFDTVQMPLNIMDAHFRSFEKQVLPVLVKADTGVIGMKALGDGLVLQSKVATAPECLRYALSLPTSVVVTGIDSRTILNQALDVAKTFTPLTPAETAALLARSKAAAAKGRFEKFKTTNAFDSTAKTPAWLGEPDRMPG